MLKKISILFPFLLLISGCSVNKLAINATGSIVEYTMDALMEESDLVFAEESAHGNLKLLEGLIKADPENEKFLFLAAKGFSSYALAFLEDNDKERAKIFYERGKGYGLRILLKNKRFNEAFNNDIDSFNQSLESFGRDDVSALFWTGFSWGGWINMNLDLPEALVDIPKVESVMRRVMELDETYYYGGVHLFFGISYGSRSRILGGNLEKARVHFDMAEKISKGNFLIDYYYKAKYYAMPIQDRSLFEGLLEKVITSPLDLLPEQRLVNEVAKVKAKNLLYKIDEYF